VPRKIRLDSLQPSTLGGAMEPVGEESWLAHGQSSFMGLALVPTVSQVRVGCQPDNRLPDGLKVE